LPIAKGSQYFVLRDAVDIAIKMAFPKNSINLLFRILYPANIMNVERKGTKKAPTIDNTDNKNRFLGLVIIILDVKRMDSTATVEQSM
jgi:hypothetical protein